MSQSDITTTVAQFFNQYPEHHYAKGQVLMLSGDYDGHIYFLTSGTVKVYDVSYRGDEIILNIYKPGAFFPMSLAMNGGDNPYIYEAESDIVFKQAPATEVVAFLRHEPTVLYDLLSRVYRGTDGLYGRLTKLMSGTAKTRLMYEVVVEAKRFGKSTSKGVQLTVNEKDLGARAGLSRETVSREMAKLKHDKLISIEHGGIVVTDLAALEAKLE